MKSIVYERFGSPDVLHIRETEMPEPKDNEILVRVRATAVSATDSAFRSGNPFIARLAAGATKPRLPTLGDGFAGDVVVVGRDVTRFKIGDRVFGAAGPTLGAHAEYIALAEDAGIAQIPNGIAAETAAALADGGLTAMPFVRDKVRIRPGHKVLVNGAAGAIGSIAIQLARHFGAHVTGVAGGRNLDLLRSLGADEVIDYGREDFTLRRDAYDVIFDAVGKSRFTDAKNALKRGGVFLTTVPSIGVLLRTKLPALFGGKRAVFAATGLRQPADKARDLTALGELAASGALRVVIDRVYPFDDFAAAHARVDSGHKVGAIVLVTDAVDATDGLVGVERRELVA